MKIIKIEYLLRQGNFSQSPEFKKILNEIRSAIQSVHWPTGSGSFILHPGKNFNGVVPIKASCMQSLIDCGWHLERRMAIASRLRPGKIDAVKNLQAGRCFAVEWETGNVSSSHRALNKMAIGLMDGILLGGVLIVPSREMYFHLTDRIGNYPEIEPYFPVWRDVSITEGVLAVVVVEHDALSTDVPMIKKGTDGRALR